MKSLKKVVLMVCAIKTENAVPHLKLVVKFMVTGKIKKKCVSDIEFTKMYCTQRSRAYVIAHGSGGAGGHKK